MSTIISWSQIWGIKKKYNFHEKIKTLTNTKIYEKIAYFQGSKKDNIIFKSCKNSNYNKILKENIKGG